MPLNLINFGAENQYSSLLGASEDQTRPRDNHQRDYFTKTKPDLRARIHITTSTLSKIENGPRTPVDGILRLQMINGGDYCGGVIISYS